MVTTFLVPVLLIGLFYLSHRIKKPRTVFGPEAPVIIADKQGLSTQLTQLIAEHNETAMDDVIDYEFIEDQGEPSQGVDDLKQLVRSGRSRALLVIGAVDRHYEPDAVLYVKEFDPSHQLLASTIERLLSFALSERQLETMGYTHDRATKLLRRANVQVVRVGMGTEDSTAETDAVLPFVIMLTMFYVITTTGRHILGSVVEEKSSRIVEVLISHVSPLELITGKLLGLSAIGLAVSGIWFVVAFAGIYMGKIDVTLEPANAVYFAAYFILGFLFLASVMIGIGAACGTDKQARNLAGYVMLILTASIVLSPHVVDQPNGAVATWLSFIPITASTTMMLRLACGYEFVPMQHVVGSLLALVAAIVLSTWVAARIFRTGMLLYGKQASVSEIATWLLRG